MPLDAAQMAKAPTFRLPGHDARTVVIGATGSGKTTFGGWLLAQQNMTARPWVIFDYKGEELFDLVGEQTIRPLGVGEMPGKQGLYLTAPLPGQDDAVEAMLWALWKRGNVGVFADETALFPHQAAFKAILRQGRSKRIPLIACTQRPVDVEREVFSEAGYVALFRLDDIRDLKTVGGFARAMDIDAGEQLPEHWCHWYDKAQFATWTIKPVPDKPEVARMIRAAVPRKLFFR